MQMILKFYWRIKVIYCNIISIYIAQIMLLIVLMQRELFLEV